MKYLLTILMALALTIPVRAEVPTKEREANTCFLSAQAQWNTVITYTPHDKVRLLNVYEAFAKCATIAIETGETLPNGNKVPWLPEYFASTMGALFSQLQLAEVDKPNRCQHLSLSRDLADQAIGIETQMGQQADPDFDDGMAHLYGHITQALHECS